MSENLNMEAAEVSERQHVKPDFGKIGEKRREAVSPINGARLPLNGRQKGVPNKVTRTIREAVEMAARDCHPKGLAGWLIERAQGGVQDRQIFATMVAKALPLQVNANINGGITIHMPWLAQRAVSGANVAQLDVGKAQVIDAIDVLPLERRIDGQAVTQAGGGEQAGTTGESPQNGLQGAESA